MSTYEQRRKDMLENQRQRRRECFHESAALGIFRDLVVRGVGKESAGERAKEAADHFTQKVFATPCPAPVPDEAKSTISVLSADLSLERARRRNAEDKEVYLRDELAKTSDALRAAQDHFKVEEQARISLTHKLAASVEAEVESRLRLSLVKGHQDSLLKRIEALKKENAEWQEQCEVLRGIARRNAKILRGKKGLDKPS